MIKNESLFSSVSRTCSSGVSYYIVVLVYLQRILIFLLWFFFSIIALSFALFFWSSSAVIRDSSILLISSCLQIFIEGYVNDLYKGAELYLQYYCFETKCLFIITCMRIALLTNSVLLRIVILREKIYLCKKSWI